MSEKLVLLFSPEFNSYDLDLQSELYNVYYRLVYDMVIYIVRDHASTEDIIQESFIRILEHPPKMIDVNKIHAWLKTVTRNTTLNYLRKYKKTRDELAAGSVYIEEIINVFIEKPPTIEEQIIKQESREALKMLLKKLKPEYTLVLELKYVHEMSYIEIADIVGTTEGAIRQRLSRARSALKANLLHK